MTASHALSQLSYGPGNGWRKVPRTLVLGEHKTQREGRFFCGFSGLAQGAARDAVLALPLHRARAAASELEGDEGATRRRRVMGLRAQPTALPKRRLLRRRPARSSQ